MSNTDYAYFTTPPGRYVSGSHVIPRTKDNQGNPKIIKNGPNMGKPTQSFDFGIAIPKGKEQSWKDTAWGQVFVQAAMKSWPNGQYNLPNFAWKIIDGDSTVPNTAMKRPCDSEGYPGHWIIYFSSNSAPQCVDRTGHNQIDPNSFKKGDWIQVAGSTIGNNNMQKPGMFVNHKIVSFQWADKPIVSGPDPTQMGFGATQAPAGASMQPTGSFVAPAPVQTAPVAPAAAAPAMAPPPAAPVAPVPVVPHTAILNPPAPKGPVMTAKAGGAKYEDFIKNNWTDELLIKEGYMVAS